MLCQQSSMMSSSSPKVSRSVRTSADVLAHALGPAHGPMPEEPFLGAVALLLAGPGALAHAALVLDVVAEHAGIGRDLHPGRAAEQAPDRLVEPATFQVPERAVDRADRHHRLALAAVHERAVHQVPQELAGARVAAREQRCQLGCDDLRDRRRHRPGDAVHALVRVDPKVRRLEPKVALVDLLGGALIAEPQRALAAELVVDVERPQQPLLPERPVGRDGAAQGAKADLVDLQGIPLPVPPSWCGQTRARRPRSSRSDDQAVSEDAGANISSRWFLYWRSCSAMYCGSATGPWEPVVGLRLVCSIILAEFGRALAAAQRYENLRYGRARQEDFAAPDIASRLFEEFYARRSGSENADRPDKVQRVVCGALRRKASRLSARPGGGS